ncbi:hypothetical protein CUR178_00665 [Leishmania enriettii]|uniref:Flagellum transition zone component n=1 Tax=Leishmania enriettii TaxID=5663 RepID=A0A836KCN4_LEIEN|nr:hypothetical protein CUR178_00665 [Leishmania enriettii]
MMKEHLWRPGDASDEGIYARSPLTTSEEAKQFLPGCRLLSTTEFKRIYLGDGAGGNSSTMVTAGYSSSSANGVLTTPAHPPTLLSSHAGWGPRCGSSHVIRPPRRPATGIAARVHRKDDGAGTARQLRYLYGGAGGSKQGSIAFEAHTPSPRMRADEHRPFSSSPLTGGASLAVVPASVCATHKPLPHQLRSRVRLARRASSPTERIHSGAGSLHRGQLRTEDAWLELTRELMNRKDEVHSLQQRLRHAHVLLRSLHGVRGGIADDDGDAADADAAADVDTAASGVATDSKPTGCSALEVAASTQRPRPREYWQRRAYFLMRRNEELQAESDRLRCDSRGSKVHALMQELKSVRRELSRYRRQTGASTALSASANVLMSESGGAEAGLGSPQRGDGNTVSSPAGPCLLDRVDAASSSRAPAADDSFLREKDETIRDLRERLRLLTQQYQKTDAGLVAATRRLEDVMHRHNAMLVEWKALVALPQELARTQQQLAITQARLLDSEREVEAFRQLFDTQASPATLRAVVDERNHLVELLRQSQQKEAALRDEMKAAQQQLVRSVEKKYCEQYAEEQAMARDRDAQQEETVQLLRKQVAALEQQLEVQREAYEAQLAERAEARETEMTQLLLESVRRPETGTWSAALSASRSLSAGALPRPTLPDGQRPTTADFCLAAGGAPLHRPSAEQTKRDPMLRAASFSKSTASSTSAEDPMTGAAAQDGIVSSTERDAGESTLTSISDTADSSTASRSLTRDTEGEASSFSSLPVHQSRNGTGVLAAVSTSQRCNEYVSDVIERQQPEIAAVVAATAVTGTTRAASTCSSAANDYGDSEGGRGDEETAEKASGSRSDSSAASSTRSSLTPTSAVDDATVQQESSLAETKAAPSSTHTHIMDLPAPPLAAVSAVSILVNRTSITGPLLPPNIRAVVHSPDMSSQGTVSVAEHTHTQQMLTGNSEAKSSSDYLSEGSFSSSPSSSSSLNLPRSGGDEDGTSATAGPSESELHDGSVKQVKEGDVATPDRGTSSGAQVLTEAVMRPLLPLAEPHVAAPLPTFPAQPTPPSRTEEAVAASLSAAAQPASERKASVSLLRFAAASGSTTLPSRSVPIPSLAALTPAVDSSSYPPRRNSSCLLTGVGSDDDFGGAAGTSRSGMGSRMHSNEHASFDFTPQCSGNASFDFVGLLAERHCLEDMQNALAFSRQSSVAAAEVSGVVGGAAFASLGDTLSGTSSDEHAVMGTGAAGLRKTPSPLLDSDILPPRQGVLSTCDDDGGEGESGAKAAVGNDERPDVNGTAGQSNGLRLAEVSYQGGDDDAGSSISSQRATAVTREREEMPLADAASLADPADCAPDSAPSCGASAAKDPEPGGTIPRDLDGIADLDAPSSSAAIELSHASHTILSSNSKTLTREKSAVLSFGFEDRGEEKLEAGHVEFAGPPIDPSAAAATAEPLHPPDDTVMMLPEPLSEVSITTAAAAPSYVPLPPRVSVPAAPRATLPSPPQGLVPLPPRVEVPLPPSSQATKS